jgi:hypothetical protein
MLHQWRILWQKKINNRSLNKKQLHKLLIVVIPKSKIQYHYKVNSITNGKEYFKIFVYGKEMETN